MVLVNLHFNGPLHFHQLLQPQRLAGQRWSSCSSCLLERHQRGDEGNPSAHRGFVLPSGGLTHLKLPICWTCCFTGGGRTQSTCPGQKIPFERGYNSTSRKEDYLQESDTLGTRNKAASEAHRAEAAGSFALIQPCRSVEQLMEIIVLRQQTSHLQAQEHAENLLCAPAKTESLVSTCSPVYERGILTFYSIFRRLGNNTWINISRNGLSHCDCAFLFTWPNWEADIWIQTFHYHNFRKQKIIHLAIKSQGKRSPGQKRETQGHRHE